MGRREDLKSEQVHHRNGCLSFQHYLLMGPVYSGRKKSSVIFLAFQWLVNKCDLVFLDRNRRKMYILSISSLHLEVEVKIHFIFILCCVNLHLLSDGIGY